MMPKLTLDTNLLLEYWKRQEKVDVVEELLGLADGGKVELAVTSRVREDVREAPLAHKINELPQLGIRETGSITRLGFWRLGKDRLASQAFVDFSERKTELAGARAPDWRDWDHLHAHFLQGRHVFLTWDKGILDLASDLRREFSISVMTPEDFFLSLHTSSCEG